MSKEQFIAAADWSFEGDSCTNAGKWCTVRSSRSCKPLNLSRCAAHVCVAVSTPASMIAYYLQHSSACEQALRRDMLRSHMHWMLSRLHVLPKERSSGQVLADGAKCVIYLSPKAALVRAVNSTLSRSIHAKVVNIFCPQASSTLDLLTAGQSALCGHQGIPDHGG